MSTRSNVINDDPEVGAFKVGSIQYLSGVLKLPDKYFSITKRDL